MTALFDDFEQFKRLTSKLDAEVNQAKGAYAEILGRLKKEFGVKDLKAAKVKLRKMRAKELKLSRAYTRLRTEHAAELKRIKERQKWQSVIATLLAELIRSAETPSLLSGKRKRL
jgi:hypothetical protein